MPFGSLMCSSGDSQTKSVLLDKAKRPDEVDHWLKHGRKFNAMPMVNGEFGAAWMGWWLHLQPEWRGSGPNLSKDIPEHGSWTELQKGGPNGFFLLILSYCWWGISAINGEDKQEHALWEDTYDDIEWVLQKMISGLNASLKRIRDAEDVADPANLKPVSKRWVFPDNFGKCPLTQTCIPLDLEISRNYACRSS